MFILIEDVYREGSKETYVMGCYDTHGMAQKSMTALQEQVDIDDNIEYDIQSVPKNLEFTNDG